MTVDTSAIVAIVRAEPEAQQCLSVVLRASNRRISAGNLLESYLVIDGSRNPALSAKLDAILENLRLVVEPVTPEHIRIARDAFRRYGKGSGHGARLNYGDCFAYALARSRDEPLLFIGNDFSQTDITPAMYIRLRSLIGVDGPTQSRHYDTTSSSRPSSQAAFATSATR